MLTTRQVPRTVPTLTEVVRPGSAPVPPPVIDCNQLAEQVLQILKPRLEQQLRASLIALINDQIRQASEQWQPELEAAVRLAVEQALGQSQPPKK